MSDEEDDIEEDLVVVDRTNKHALSQHALRYNWTLDVQVEQCDGCGETHCEEAWWWGHGFVQVEVDSFIVVFDPSPGDPAMDLVCYETDEMSNALFLIQLLTEKYPPIPMPAEPAL